MELLYPICRVVLLSLKHEIIALIKEAIEFHIEGMKLDSNRIPKPKIKAIELETTYGRLRP